MTQNLARSKTIGSADVEWEPYYVMVSGSPTQYGPYTGPASVDYYSHLGFNTKDFHARQKRGELIPITAWNQKSIRGRADGSYSLDRNGKTVYTVGNFVEAREWSLSSADVGDLVQELSLNARAELHVQRAAAKIYSQGWDVLTFLATLNLTKRLFTDFIKNLRKYSSRPQELYNRWLEGRYGWRLLMYDLQDIQEALQKLGEDERTRFNQASGYGVTESRETSVVYASDVSERTYWFKDTIDANVTSRVIADIVSPTYQFNPVLTAWELIPWSFVLDWIVDIGQAIEAASFLVFQNRYFASEGYRIDVTRVSNGVGVVAMPNPLDGYGPWSNIIYELDSECKVSVTSRAPATVSLLPPLNLNLDAFKILDLIALFHGVGRR